MEPLALPWDGSHPSTRRKLCRRRDWAGGGTGQEWGARWRRMEARREEVEADQEGCRGGGPGTCPDSTVSLLMCGKLFWSNSTDSLLKCRIAFGGRWCQGVRIPHFLSPTVDLQFPPNCGKWSPYFCVEGWGDVHPSNIQGHVGGGLSGHTESTVQGGGLLGGFLVSGLIGNTRFKSLPRQGWVEAATVLAPSE